MKYTLFTILLSAQLVACGSLMPSEDGSDVVSQDQVTISTSDSPSPIADSNIQDDGPMAANTQDSTTRDSSSEDAGNFEGGGDANDSSLPDVPTTCPAGTPANWVYYPCLGGSHCAPPGHLNDGNDDFIMHNCGACGHVCPPNTTRCVSGMCF